MLKNLATTIVTSGVMFLIWGTSPMVPLTTAPQTAIASGKPTFQTITAENIRRTTHIVSSRSTAALGFDTPLVRIYLPRTDSSAYAVVTFDTPGFLTQADNPLNSNWSAAGTTINCMRMKSVLSAQVELRLLHTPGQRRRTDPVPAQNCHSYHPFRKGGQQPGGDHQRPLGDLYRSKYPRYGIFAKQHRSGSRL